MPRQRPRIIRQDIAVELPPQLTAPELLAANLQPRELILDPILATDSLALLYGPRGLGKTFVALNLAMSIASEVDSTVLLIDADVANPNLMKKMHLPPARGLLDLLHRDAAARPGLEFDYHFLADILGHRLGHDGGDEVGRGALAERDDNGDRSIRIGLGLKRRDADETREQAAYDRTHEDVTLSIDYPGART